MTYELIGQPRIESEYSDEWETTMACDVRRDDGVTGDVWIVAGVPDYLRGSSEAAHTQRGYERVRVFGDSPEHWCPDVFVKPDWADIDVIATVHDDVLAALESAALAAHRERVNASA